MRCKSCLVEKNSEDFYSSNKGKCKECIKRDIKKNRLEKIEYYRQYDRMRGSMPHRVAARKEYQKTDAWKVSHAKSLKKSAEKYPERAKARIKFSNAVRDGKVSKLPCFVCGCENTEGHHPDYGRPLDVVWLCNKHHTETHEMIKDSP